MQPTIKLLLGVHAHQPVGNFPEVIHDAHLRCYRPFLHTLYEYPQFRFAVHFSGWLLEFLFQHHPNDIAMLREMVQRGQVEIFGGGDTEPILAAIPYRDRVGQIVTLSNRLERQLTQRPTGAWLTERVWEGTVVPALVDAGIRYVTVDDYHFLCTGLGATELNGYFTTEEDGRQLGLFPISEQLRYRIPFAPADEVVRYIESLADDSGQAAAIYFDDIEKLGIWPETFDWVYTRGWLKQFVEGVLQSNIISTGHYGEYHRDASTHGIVYLPTTSYIEMNEWSLPAPAANLYADLVTERKLNNRYEENKAFIRGGIWKNFFSRYPESNWMHKRMLRLSERLSNLPAELATPRMRVLLYQAQANDAYWHGLFGGLYLPHLRRALYRAMIELEAHLDRSAPRLGHYQEDLDSDGHKELFLHNETIQMVVNLDGTATIRELDSYPLAHNFVDTLRRQSEHYRRKIQAGEAAANAAGGIASAHDRVSFKSLIVPSDLAIDHSGKGLFHDKLYPTHVGYETVEPRYSLVSEGNQNLIFTAETYSGTLYKEVHLGKNSISVGYSFERAMRGFLEIELNLSMPSCDGPAGRYWFRGQCPGGFGQMQKFTDLTELALEDDVLSGSLVLQSSRPLTLTARPFFTVSQSEAGFEKIMQAVSLVIHYPFSADADSLQISLEVFARDASFAI
jgi:4-alpha-glucanotransferase